MPPSAVIAMVVEQRHVEQRALADARACFEEAGCDVEVVVPGSDALYAVAAERPRWDAVLSRGRDAGGLALVAAAAARGVLAFNRPEAIERSRNKVAMHALLAEHGLPAPRTWFASSPDAFRHLPREAFPIVVKPYDGDGSGGLVLVVHPHELAAVPSDGRSLLLAQELVHGDGVDVKLYGVGRHIWAVRKPASVAFDGAGPARLTCAEAAEPAPLDDELRDIALTCGRALGLELWGVDVVVTATGPIVIEVNDFPTYSALDDAGREIARHVLASVELEALLRASGRAHAATVLRSAA